MGGAGLVPTMPEVISLLKLVPAIIIFIISIKNVESCASHSFPPQLVLILHHVQPPSLIRVLVVHKLPPLHVSVIVLQPSFLHISLLLLEFDCSLFLVMTCKVFVETVPLMNKVRAGRLRNMPRILHLVVVITTSSIH